MASTTMTQTTTTTTTEVKQVADLPASAEDLIRTFNNTKATIKLLQAEKENAEKALRELLGDAEVGTINGVERVKISHRNMSKIDREALKAAWPEAYEATLLESSYTVLTTK
jgi:predicted phage-related endonuclease